MSDFDDGPSDTPIKPLCVSVNTTCGLLSIGRTKTFELIKRRQLKSFLLGKKRLVTVQSIEELIESGES